MRLKKLFNNRVVEAGSWYTLTNFFLKGIGFLTIPIFTRLLNTSDYGIVSLYSTWVGIFSVIIGLSLGESIRRARYDYKENYDKFVSSIVFLSFLTFMLFFVLFCTFREFFENFTGLKGILFYLMIFQAFFSYINGFAITKFQFEYKYKVISVINILMSVAGVFLSVFLITYIFPNQKYLGKIIGGTALLIIVGTYFFFYLLKKGKTYVNYEYWKYALLLCLPLIFHQLSHLINMQFDRILINKYIGSSATGVYSFAYNVGMIIQIVFISLDQAWNPWFFEKFKDKEYTTIRKNAVKLRDTFTLIYLVILMLSPELIKMMATKEYWVGLKIVPWIAMSYYFNFIYAFEVNVEYAHKRTGLISIGTILSAIINIGLNVIFIPIYGYVAAAVTTVISYLFLFIFHYILTSKVIKDIVYGLKFHVVSICYVFFITFYFIIFEKSILMRVLFVVLVFFIFHNVKKDSRKNILN